MPDFARVIRLLRIALLTKLYQYHSNIINGVAGLTQKHWVRHNRKVTFLEFPVQNLTYGMRYNAGDFRYVKVILPLTMHKYNLSF